MNAVEEVAPSGRIIRPDYAGAAKYFQSERPGLPSKGRADMERGKRSGSRVAAPN
jgi:hypothetical protein